ncbi:Predicted arabinose efflux permease, MFS family [Sulfobacillus thermosulfidooxidans DSM 9293]|uniref:Predicted arabinose efflux permease, MFS family n=2 Tax=Sulfobacillus thermosulfidooxidans TaxID=28034 RepID=A0A1W1WL76_SULTA|nr:multidrug efflux MFS transporter [Sulfobacillus thermosulfidooxidans]PSR25205.1 MAG: MFS transporter [Sulfobacillus thermosulfidooxidans]SMC07068.1 Predicted arabinose efflux permease, MFS family [Sulfobacillus thermosulfidooxidans DSM 9293]
MEAWRRNLYVLWITNFIMGSSMSLVIPFLPIYIQQLGIHQLSALERWSGLVFSATFMVSAFVQPLWGRLSDRVGRKVMLIRSGIGMALVMASMGFVHHVWQLFALRGLLGAVAGFIVSATALQATQTPPEQAGRALGTLQTGAVAGNLIGPFLGGVLADTIGIRHVFFLTGILQILATLLVIFFVQENFRPSPAATRMSDREFLRKMRQTGIILPLFVVTLVIQMGYLSIEPIVTIYVRQLEPHAKNISTLAGATFAAIGLGNIISAPRLGKLADKIGAQRVLLVSLVIAAVLYLPQAYVHNAYQLMVLRLILGLAVGGLQPSVQALIRRYTPTSLQGRAFGFNSSFLFAGNLVGPLLGGFVSSIWHIQSVFYVTAILLFIDAMWLYYAIIRFRSRILPAS